MFQMFTSMNSSTQLSQLQWTSVSLSFLPFCRSVSIVLYVTLGQDMSSSLPEGFLTQLYWNEMFSFLLLLRPKAPGSSMSPYVPDKIAFCTRERAGQRTGTDMQSEKPECLLSLLPLKLKEKMRDTVLYKENGEKNSFVLLELELWCLTKQSIAVNNRPVAEVTWNGNLWAWREGNCQTWWES